MEKQLNKGTANVRSTTSNKPKGVRSEAVSIQADEGRLTTGNHYTDRLLPPGHPLENNITVNVEPLVNHEDEPIDMELTGIENFAIGISLVVLVALIAFLAFRLVVVILGLFPPVFTF